LTCPLETPNGGTDEFAVCEYQASCSCRAEGQFGGMLAELIELTRERKRQILSKTKGTLQCDLGKYQQKHDFKAVQIPGSDG
jgi:hypothetical protein